MVRPRREPAKGWPPNRESHRICDPITLDAVWYRQFSGASRLARGREEFSLRIPIALILMTVQPKADQPSAETGADQTDTE